MYATLLAVLCSFLCALSLSSIRFIYSEYGNFVVWILFTVFSAPLLYICIYCIKYIIPTLSHRWYSGRCFHKIWFEYDWIIFMMKINQKIACWKVHRLECLLYLFTWRTSFQIIIWHFVSETILFQKKQIQTET